MFKLHIKHGDGTHYWSESFNTHEACIAWLAEEKTRPYWKPDFTFVIEDHTPLPKSEHEAAAEQNRLNVQKARLAQVKSLLSKEDQLNAMEVRTLVATLAKVVLGE